VEKFYHPIPGQVPIGLPMPFELPPILFGTANPIWMIISGVCVLVMGEPKAITTTAHKLVRIIFHLIKNQKEFDETLFFEQEQLHLQRLKNRLEKQAKSLGFQIVPV
jgi:Sec-independent protein translocase protein TatA